VHRVGAEADLADQLGDVVVDPGPVDHVVEADDLA